MNNKDQRYSWHLTEGELSALTNFEFSLWRVFYPFMLWQEECEKYINDNTFSAYDIAVLHVIKIQDKPKSVNDICNLLNRNDTQTVHYSIKKLMNEELIQSSKAPNSRKAKLYSVTEKGNTNIKKYSEARNEFFSSQIEKFNINTEDLEKLEKTLIRLKGLYEEVSKIMATFNDDIKINIEKNNE